MLSVTYKQALMQSVFMLNVVMLSVVMLSVVMLSVFMLSVVMLSVIMVSVVALISSTDTRSEQIGWQISFYTVSTKCLSAERFSTKRRGTYNIVIKDWIKGEKEKKFSRKNVRLEKNSNWRNYGFNSICCQSYKNPFFSSPLAFGNNKLECLSLSIF